MTEGLEIRLAEQITDEEREALFGWGENIFGIEDGFYRWRPKDWHFIVEEGGRAVGHVGVVRHTVEVAGAPVEVGGIGAVVTVPEVRGKGYAQAGMRRAAEFMCGELGVEAGLLFCRDPLVPFYARLGWQLVGDPVEVEQPSGKIVMPLNVMVLPCAGRSWPAGAVSLNSLPW